MLDVNIDLVNNNGFKWYRNNNVYVKGYVFDKNNKFYEKEQFVKLFDDIEDIITLENLIQSINGFFAIVIKKEFELYIVVDRLRSIPLFYTQSQNSIQITDLIKFDSHIKKETPEYFEFIQSGYTLNDSTLLSNYKQVQPSEILYFKKDILNKRKYFKHSHQDYLKEDYKDYYKDLDEITDNFTKRLISSVGDQTIVLPLSGGYDSRYILSALKKHNFVNVVCYTYGDKNSFEVLIAIQVAEILGYKLHIIEYTDKKWNDLLENEKFIKYIDYSFNYSSLPHIQDFIALNELVELELIPERSIIVPGFCGDLLGGSYIPFEFKENNKKYLLNRDISKYILDNHFCNVDINVSDNIKDNIISKIDLFKTDIATVNDFISINESFFTEHKVAKFVVNALRVYEFFGYEWRMPLWDNDLMEYWYKVPNNLRIDNQLYNNYLFDKLFDIQDIGFKKDKSISQNKYYRIIKEILPLEVFKQLKRFYKKNINNNDVNNFNNFMVNLESDVNSKIKYNNVNGLFAFWLLEKIK